MTVQSEISVELAAKEFTERCRALAERTPQFCSATNTARWRDPVIVEVRRAVTAASSSYARAVAGSRMPLRVDVLDWLTALATTINREWRLPGDPLLVLRDLARRRYAPDHVPQLVARAAELDRYLVDAARILGDCDTEVPVRQPCPNVECRQLWYRHHDVRSYALIVSSSGLGWCRACGSEWPLERLALLLAPAQ